MKARLICLAVLALGSGWLATTAGAQASCSTPSVECLFGTADGDSITCPPNDDSKIYTCVCSPARCRLGIPFDGHCSCKIFWIPPGV